MIAASAPGKLFVSGEYAVLRGAPAVVMAVDRRALARRDPGNDGIDLQGSTAAGDTRLIEAVAAALQVAPPLSGLRLDTTAFAGARGKYGIGSSAALCAALTALLLGDATPEAVLPAALAAHRALQGGGSGADVAASVYGGIIAYRMDDSITEPLSWPPGLGFALFNTGVPASTPDRIAAFDARADGDAVTRLHAAAEDCAAAWKRGAPAGICTAQRHFADALSKLDDESGLNIYAAGHRRLYDAARGTAVVYKPCGAGGGDLGLALSTDSAALDEFSVSAESAGLTRLDFAVDPGGVRIDGAET